MHPASIVEDFNHSQIISYNLNAIKEYIRVPSTNADSLIEPIGLMLEKEFEFNKKGQLKTRRCKYCYVRSHGDPSAVDFIQTLNYEDNLLNEFTEFEFDTTYYQIRYFDSKSLTRGFRKDKQGYTSVERYDSQGRIITRIGFEFFFSYHDDKGFRQISPTKTVYDYNDTHKTIKTYKLTSSFNTSVLTQDQFSILTSDDCDELEKLMSHFKLKLSKNEIHKVDKSGKLLERSTLNINYPDQTIYHYDSSHLLNHKIELYNVYESIHEFRYDFW